MHFIAIPEQLKVTKEFFDRSTRALTEEDSNFKAYPDAFTVAQQVAHTAQTIDWFFEGAFRPECFDMDFEKATQEILAITSLTKAREMLDASFAKAIETAKSKTDAEWAACLPPNPIMGELPRFVIVGSLVDHTAHHRGALTVYTRLLGKIPPMPYADM
ncbi:MAG TPA: DinB family protein [Bryobacteraceae bacterium]|nr:DinB family protein [Bryobacteraceae bacterium]